MHLIVINLARATERRARLGSALEALGLQAEWLRAIDGASELTDAQRSRADQGARRAVSPYPLSDNEIACFLSHCRAMERLLESGLPMAVVLEDDAELLDGFVSTIEQIGAMTRSFDVIDLHRTFKRGEIFHPVDGPGTVPGLGRIGHTHVLATGYVISAAGARRFLAQTARFAYPFDKEIHRYWRNGLDLYGIARPVVVQNDAGHSFIDEDRHQNAVQLRPTYPHAWSAWWKLRRGWTRAVDRRLKHAAFARWRDPAAS
ncbi:N/A [soil metagenome]